MEKKGSTEQRGLMTAAEAQKRLEMLLAQKDAGVGWGEEGEGESGLDGVRV